MQILLTKIMLSPVTWSKQIVIHVWQAEALYPPTLQPLGMEYIINDIYIMNQILSSIC